jgi:hypothetical protein
MSDQPPAQIAGPVMAQENNPMQHCNILVVD